MPTGSGLQFALVLAGGVITLVGTVVTQWLQWRHERERREEEHARDKKDRREAEEAQLNEACIARVEVYTNLMSDYWSAAIYHRDDALRRYVEATPHHFPALAAAAQLDEDELTDAVKRLADSGALMADALRNGEWLLYDTTHVDDDSQATKLVDNMGEALTDTLNAVQTAKLKLIHGLL